jgi:hypothetical protein
MPSMTTPTPQAAWIIPSPFFFRYRFCSHPFFWPLFRLLSCFSFKPFIPPPVHRLALPCAGACRVNRSSRFPLKVPPNFPV